MPHLSRHYKLSFTDPEMEGVHVTLRAMSLEEALSYDEVRMTPAANAKELRAQVQERAARLAAVVVEWDLQDAKGEPVPATQAGVMGLEQWVRDQIERGMFEAYNGAAAPLDQAPAADSIESSLPMQPLPAPGSDANAPGS